MKDRGKKEECCDCSPDTLADYSGSFKLDLGATGLAEIIRAGGAGSNLQSRAREEQSLSEQWSRENRRPDKKRKHLNTNTHRIWNNSGNDSRPPKPAGTNSAAYGDGKVRCTCTHMYTAEEITVLLRCGGPLWNFLSLSQYAIAMDYHSIAAVNTFNKALTNQVMNGEGEQKNRSRWEVDLGLLDQTTRIILNHSFNLVL